MISPWRCARVSAGSRRRALPTSPASRLVTVPGCSWPSGLPWLFPWSRGGGQGLLMPPWPLCVSLAGDILTCINGVGVEGFGHKQIVDLIKSSGNYLRLETVNGAFFLRKMELETKLRALKALHQRWGELRALLARERLLLHGEVNDNALLGSLEPVEPGLVGGCSSPGPFLPGNPRLSSESSSRSRLSSMTVGSEDSFYQGSAAEDWAAESLSRQSSLDDDCVFPRDGAGAAGRASVRRHRSISLAGSSASPAGSGSASPLWDGGGGSSSFGTLPRKSRRASVRKHLLKFIPGFQRAVEEEESRV
ncbi:cytohesin-interacting protein isoform X3 [Ammospiza nelsoni]|uniref:cytohesin-interacting protein isoform X3 n=1 Tax=Ammospiza nelsoni TaxID=2857394 RepID=UPI00286CE2EB|nr:cytohesin-interacting protein isoform X3 [Ammospiza nelsoni]